MTISLILLMILHVGIIVSAFVEDKLDKKEKHKKHER